MSVVIAANTVVTLNIEMRDAQNALLRSDDSVSYLHGAPSGLFDALEAALAGKSAGETVQVQLEPDQAFGDYEPELLRLENMERYGEGLKVGMEIEDALGGDPVRRYTVTDIAAGKVVLDGNHPLAGMALRFTCRILAVRPATRFELERGDVTPADTGTAAGKIAGIATG